ncbi:cytochrome P450 [Streptomyces sp. NRRL S-646]|uniref:cytochrome P450 n=1 Tax=Streptomyces sp. NRRL S-646 TaxID=1463917 RepID=UPI0004C60D65|nr:cytochrome P450 [Streptomyces sp. NRRL S-646]
MTAPRPVPAVGLRENLSGLAALRRDQVGHLCALVRRHGDIFRVLLGGMPVVMLNHPDLVQHVLVDHHTTYDKDTFMYRSVRSVIGDGLVAHEGGRVWHQRRRMLQPAFHRASVSRFTSVMADETDRMLAAWTRHGGEASAVDVTASAADLALKIVLRSLFGAASDERAARFEQDFLETNALAGAFFRFPFPPLGWPTPAHRRLRSRVAAMHGFIAELIDSRTHRGGDDPARPDLFSLLLHALDEETGSRLTREQVTSEVLSMIVAGYETTSNAIAWICHQLAHLPEVQLRLQDEVDRVLGGRTPRFKDLTHLTYARMVVDETLRLFTPAWQTMRRAAADDVVGGHRIPAGTGIYINFLTLHRHPEFWPDPERFDPERFDPKAQAGRPRHAYQPFGAGPRHCIGKHFALTELLIITVMIAQSCTLARVPGTPRTSFAPLLTLHPADNIRLHIRSRRPHDPASPAHRRCP